MRLPEWIFSIYCLSMHCKRVRVNGIFLGLQQKSQAFFQEQIIFILLRNSLLIFCKINKGNTFAKRDLCAICEVKIWGQCYTHFWIPSLGVETPES